MKRPRARNDGVLTTELDDELIVYDSERKWAHTLNPTAASVWRYCDGRHTISDLQRAVSVALGSLVDDEAIALALRQLDRAHLLVDGFQPTGSGVTRREMLRKAGLIGAGAVVAPAVFSAPVPAAAALTSCIGPGGTCVPNLLPTCCNGPLACVQQGKVHICL